MLSCLHTTRCRLTVRAYAQGHEPGCPTCGLQQRDPAMAGKSYYRFRDVGSPLAVTASFAPGHAFGCAFVQKGSTRSDGVDTMWAFGVGPNATTKNVHRVLCWLLECPAPVQIWH